MSLAALLPTVPEIAIFWPDFCSGPQSEPALSWPGRSGDEDTKPKPPPLTTAVKLKRNCSTRLIDPSHGSSSGYGRALTLVLLQCYVLARPGAGVSRRNLCVGLSVECGAPDGREVVHRLEIRPCSGPPPTRTFAEPRSG